MGRPEDAFSLGSHGSTVTIVEVDTEKGELPSSSSSSSFSTALLSYDDIPEWYQDSKDIRHGYRPVSNSAVSCLKSLGYLHNETVNIYSHLIPAILFLAGEGLLLWYFHVKYPNASVGDQLVFVLWVLSATICMGLSAGFHTLMNHSECTSQLWLQFDFMGILILIFGDFVSLVYLGFYCERKIQIIYWSMISTLILISIFILLSPKFQGLRWRTFRACVFVATGVSGLIPVIHGIALYGFPRMAIETGNPFYLGEGGLLVIGVFFYAMRIPECFKPGKFDIWGSSHQIFHIFVVLATVLHGVGLLVAYNWHYHHPCSSA